MVVNIFTLLINKLNLMAAKHMDLFPKYYLHNSDFGADGNGKRKIVAGKPWAVTVKTEFNDILWKAIYNIYVIYDIYDINDIYV